MATTLTVYDETTAGERSESIVLEFLTEQITVRELIRQRVYQEVQYLHHLVVGTLARRLIWVFEPNGEMDGGGKNSVRPDRIEATWLDDRLVDVTGEPVEVDLSSTVVSLWHPIHCDQETIVAWRRFFEDREIRQPFKQAHREIYLLTDAERTTRVYSNRYASHILKQHQYNALCGARGWNNKLRLMVDDDYPPTFIELPEWNLRAEFWVEGIGEDDVFAENVNPAGVYYYLATDQVRFYSIDAALVRVTRSCSRSKATIGWP